MRKRKSRDGPCKLTDLFYLSVHSQLWADAITTFSPCSSASGSQSKEKHPAHPAKQLCSYWDTGITKSAHSSPQKSRLAQAGSLLEQVEHSLDSSSLEEDTRELMGAIEQYPATGQPIIDITLKDVLVYLRSILHRDMISFMAQVKSDLSEIGAELVMLRPR